MFITVENIRQAKMKLANVIIPTPLQCSRTFSELSGNEVWLKPENLQKTGAFKVRGAYNKISSLTDEERARGIITCSAGNHGCGTAYAAMLAGCKATVVMPKKYVKAKKDAIEAYGSTVIPYGDNSVEMFEKVDELIASQGLTMVHPFDDPYTIAGQATIGLEILEEDPTIEAVVVQAAGGGLISGIASAVKQLKPSVKVIGVNAENSQAMIQSLKKGEPTAVPVNTIADGLGAGKPGISNFEYVKKYVDEWVTVTEAEIRDTTRLIGERAKMVVEPSGAASLAALINHKTGLKGKRVVAILSGGNADFGVLSQIYAGTLEV